MTDCIIYPGINLIYIENDYKWGVSSSGVIMFNLLESFSKPENNRSMAESIIKIIIVDNDSFVRQGMKKLIEKEWDLNVIMGTEDTEEALSFIHNEHPDLAIVDISLDAEETGLKFIKTLSAGFPGLRTLVLSIHDNNVFAERVFHAGAHGYITKDVAPSVIIESIRTVMSGKPYLYGGMPEEDK
jgi:DNA-binding NarL/FixJ family response regulator